MYQYCALALALKTSAFESLYSGQFTYLSTHLIKPNYFWTWLFSVTENVELQVPLADEFPPRAEDGDDESEEEEEIEYGSEDETDTTQDKKTLIRR